MTRSLVICILGFGKFTIYREMGRTVVICFLGIGESTIHRGISIL